MVKDANFPSLSFSVLMINVTVFSGFTAWRHGPVREKQSYQRVQETGDSYFGGHGCSR